MSNIPKRKRLCVNKRILQNLQKITFFSDTIFDGEIFNFLKIDPGFNRLKTKRRLLYLKTQFVSRSKQFSSRL